ncbi:MAG: DUF5606 domain-containing protein [Bacteroidetes bacterium]|nr:DUF5606 domain-containing protein [Bacteroidota bacterium]
MDLKGIIAIAGKPGLYKVAAQGRANIIVQSLENDKKFPAFASDKISALDDISIYTYEKDVPLVEVYTLLAEKENFGKSIDHKEEPKKLRAYLVTFLPDYDAERVYDTDVKKLFQWYNLLVEKGLISKEKAAEAKKIKEEAEARLADEQAKAAEKPVAKKSAPAAEKAGQAEKKPAKEKAAAKEKKAETPKASAAKKTTDKPAKPAQTKEGKTTKKGA